ncbi:unnamed protein product [Didymodactylos carnosus]|uniref:Limiting CO2-inducible protein B/C beta carbonyic anhydrase domain-containing protein n=1 Tax=Didymodactylos carnosus TaxID=1234261 RepID=A0A813VE86_9BILA|nr:unnamed protein product [Didymodactylos carnosus]CAF1324620.1 unnamed protein product [Didymodactylos carnosus]CAF3622595.1 unnamed protein product [Didymodactylos carnosus]CAF4135386.1 unnamed protein product [Didymodactylos carnosus]
MLIEDFVFKTKELLVPKGFYPNVNTMCCIGLCRDEITCQFKNIIESMYGAGFSCGSLAGLLFCGRTGFLAAHHHVPADSACLIYYCFTHIAISEKGEIGVVLRSKTGMKQKSTACGALMAFTNTLSEGIQLPIEIDENDVEMSCLKKHVLETVPTLSTNSTLLDVTHAAYLTITRDLEYHVLQDSKCYQKRKYALFTGIQIHGPNGHDSVWLGKSSIVQNGTLVDLPFHETNKYQT